MSSGKKININVSSLVDLKAELYRKQREIEKSKLESASISGAWLPKKVPDVWGKPNSNKKVSNQGSSEKVQDVGEGGPDVYEKSRVALEAKAKLYDKLSQTASQLGDDDDDETRETYLVDFQKKAQTQMGVEQQRITQPAEDEEVNIDVPIPPPSGPDEEWVEYTDSLGRTRQCMRKDLAFLQSQDHELAYARANTSSLLENNKWNQPGVPTEEQRREILRQKWEKEEEETKEKGTVHYQDVLFDEARAHGVGYFAFARDEETRKEQMAMLQEMRASTEEQRKKMQKMKEKRKAQMQARLKKVRERKRLKMGLPLEGSDHSEKEDSDEEVKLADIALPETSATAANETTEAPAQKVEVVAKKEEFFDSNGDPVRPWDFGKPGIFAPRKVMDQSEWVAKKRKERQAEFAPPSSYSSQHWKKAQKSGWSRELYRMAEDSPGKSQGASGVDEEEEADERSHRRGTEVAPPSTFDYYGPTSSRASRGQVPYKSRQDMEDAISAGLSFLRQQAEKKEAARESSGNL